MAYLSGAGFGLTQVVLEKRPLNRCSVVVVVVVVTAIIINYNEPHGLSSAKHTCNGCCTVLENFVISED